MNNNQLIEIEDPAEKEEDLLELLSKYNLEVYTTHHEVEDYYDAVIEVINPTNKESMEIELNDEFTLFYSYWHTHYDPYELDYNDLKTTIEEILSNQICFAISFYNNKWISSFTPDADIITYTISQLKKNIFQKNDYFIKTIKEIQEKNPEKQITTLTLDQLQENESITKTNTYQLKLEFWDTTLNKIYTL